MEDDTHELKFVCKFCFKKYPCGKSLGGHMRSHAAEFDDKIGCMSTDVNGQSSYGLRENPRKTWRAVDSNPPLPQEKICKQCGKGFHSLKALCGHMACHSDKDRSFKDDHSWSTSDNQKPLMDSHSDTEGEDRVIQTRSSKVKKVKKIVIKTPFCLVSEVDGDDQEEVAKCLMMLSRDSGFNSVVESSDNNSVILETKSSSIDMRTGYKKGGSVVPKSGVLKVKGGEVENSDSGYFLDECAKAESDVSVDGFRYRIRKYDEDEDEGVVEYRSNVARKRRYIPTPSGEKTSKYECFNCKKIFKSYQALGGHRPCHKKSSFHDTMGENSLDESTEYVARGKQVDNKKTKAKKSKGHVCPFCDRVFKNGQALGGHKRSHFIGGHDGVNNTNAAAKPDLLDLNLPAPQEDEHFSSW